MRTCLLGFLLLCTLPMFSQDNDESDVFTPKRFSSYLEMTMEGDKAYGYNAPGYVSRPGVEIWVKSFDVNLESAVSTIDKTAERSGTTYRLNGNGYYNFKTNYLFGGGYTWGKLTTNAWSKQSGHPYLSGGFIWRDGGLKGFRWTVDYLFEGTDKSNGLRGLRFHWLVPVYKQRWFLVAGIAGYSVYETGCPTCRRTNTGNGEIGFRFQR